MLNKKIRIIFWEVTKNCNLRCVHCRADSPDIKYSDELTTRQIFSIIDDISNYAKPLIIFSGGEPLKRDDIFKILQYAKKKEIKTALATNGTLIDENIAEKIKQSQVEAVSISIDGGNPQTHNKIRNIPDAFELAYQGIKNLQKYNIPIQINYTVTNTNKNELEDIYKFVIDNNIKSLHFFMLVPVGCGMQIEDTEQLNPIEYERVLNWIYKKAQEQKVFLKATCAPHYYRLLEQGRKRGKKVFEGKFRLTKGCLAGENVCFISNKAEVYPCGYLPVSAGNLLKTSFKQIWEQSKVFNDLRQTQNIKGKCGQCEYLLNCSGCRARAYFEKNDYMEEEPFCVYQPKLKK